MGGGTNTGQRGGHGQGRIGSGGVGGTSEEGPGRGKLDECIMHQVHTNETRIQLF
jgi:hypothetical protein